MVNRRVVCAALLDKHTGNIIVGPRHFDPVMFRQLETQYPNLRTERPEFEQGFIDQRGKFMDRTEALAIAKVENQIIRKTGNETELFSEDLY